MEKCIFCEIAKGKVPADIIYEDDDFLAFLDINPLTKGHTLVMPKEHVRWVHDVENFGNYFEIAKNVIKAQLESLDAKYVNIITAGLGVHHAHIHLVPRYEDDGHPEIPIAGKTQKIPEDEMKEIASKIKDKLCPSEAKKKEDKKVEKEMKEETPVSEDELTFMRREMESG